MKKITSEQLTSESILEDNVFTHTDLGIAAALMTAEFELLKLDKSNPRKVKFIFIRANGIEKVADDFWSNRLKQKTREIGRASCRERVSSPV